MNIFCAENKLFSQTPALLWQASYGGSNNDYGGYLAPTKDSGLVAVSSTYSNDGEVTGLHGNEDIWVTKLTKTGIIEWQKSLGGSASDQPYWVNQTLDFGYIIAGSSISNDGDITRPLGNDDYWIVKLNDTGGIVWRNNYGGSSTDMAQYILELPDTSYIAAGFVHSFDSDVVGGHGYSDMWVVKLSKTGGIVWKKGYGGSAQDGARAILSVPGNGYIVAGGTTSNDMDVSFSHGGSDYWVVRLDDTGRILWERTYGGSGDDLLTSFCKTLDGGYIMSGTTNSTDGDVSGQRGSNDFWAVKIDTSGNIVWKNCYGGSNADMCYSITNAPDSGYVMAGVTYSDDGQVSDNYGNMDIWVARTDKEGVLIWQKNLGGTGIDYGSSVVQTYDKNFAIIGWTHSIDHDVSLSLGLADVWVAKLQDIPTTYIGETNSEVVKIFPSPVKNTLTMLLPANSGECQIAIYNTDGKLMKCSYHTSSKFDMDVSGYSNGLYTVKLVTPMHVYHKVFLVVH